MKRISLLLLVFTITGIVLKSQNSIPINKENWNIFSGRTDTIGGREAFAGTALLKDIQFDNGTIEWDLWASGGRSYAGIVFHQQPGRDSEEFYIRPHKSNGLNADAFQYTPVFHGVSCWQLSHGEGCTRPAIMPLNEWVHFKMSVKGDRAVITMFSEQPISMVIEKLELGEISGLLGIKGPADGSAYFSNFTYTTELDIDFPAPRQYHSPEPGIIYDWEISKAMTHDHVNQYGYYEEVKDLVWNPIKAESDGMVNLTRAVIRNPSLPGWLYAKAMITSENEGLHKYQLGYSDYITVFINGKPIMSSTNGYTSRDPGFAGLIGYFDEIFLPLEKGENEVCLLIGEQFGGWGFMMRDGEAIRLAEGITQKWELKNKLNFPESVVYDNKTDLLYVSNNITSTGGGISRVTTEGVINDLEWVKGLRSPTGITISGSNIYVVERTGIAVIDIKTGEITSRINLEGCIFPNDITASEDGSLYVSDNEANKIFRVSDGIASVWMEGGDLKKPNGIECKDGLLYVGCSGDSKIRMVNIKTKKVSILAELPDGSIMDGIQALDNGTLLFSDYNGHLFHSDSDGKVSEIINTVSTQVKLADFEYIKDEKTIIIPGLYSNVLGAYSVQGIVNR